MILIFTMIFCHIVDDYYLQGWLASAKQKSRWETNAPDELYKNDYKIALIEHAFSWSFMIHIPIIISSFLIKMPYLLDVYSITLMINMCIHAFVDNLKANKKKINLVTDQIIHLFQVVITGIIYLLLIQGRK